MEPTVPTAGLGSTVTTKLAGKLVPQPFPAVTETVPVVLPKVTVAVGAPWPPVTVAPVGTVHV